MSREYDDTAVWRGEADARIRGTEVRLNALNGDLREIRTHMGDTRDGLLLLTQRVNALDTNVTKLLQQTERDQTRQMALLEKAVEQAKLKTRNIVFLLIVPLTAAFVSGLIPYLIFGGH